MIGHANGFCFFATCSTWRAFRVTHAAFADEEGLLVAVVTVAAMYRVRVNDVLCYFAARETLVSPILAV